MTRPLLVLPVALLLVAPSLSSQAPAPASEAELVARLGRTLDTLAAADQFSGVVVLARRGTIVFERAYGWADREARRPNDLATAFNLGSINKVFTATAIRQLALDGRVALDSTLGHYWPDYPNPAVRRATIRQLLEHRSGIGGNVFAAPPGGSRRDLRSNRDFLPLFVNEAPLFEPGTSQRYANAGYVVLGMLIERLSGEDYYRYVERHITGPAGMTRTAHYAVDSLPPNTALGYTRGGPGSDGSGPLRPNTAELPGRGSAAGGGYSTAADLLRFVAACRAGTIRGTPLGSTASAGGAPGTNALVAMDGPGGYDLVALANLDPPAATRIEEVLAGLLGVSLEDAGPGRVIRRP